MIVAPPVAKSCLTQVRWLENQCLQAARGVEWDWLNFYWSVRNTGAASAKYTHPNIASVYAQACGATCVQSEVGFTSLESGANAAFGVNSVKALQWASAADAFGVNH